ncbi:MAG: glucose-6-phosphate isomerase [Burkholderiaceae bacterium]|nr:glucose-6-phosphate isomerase [Burkholderiaceae bacterium]
MTPALASICAAWHALHTLARTPPSLRTLFAQQPDRFDRLSFEAAGLLLDLSKQRIDARILDALLALARERDVPARRDALLRGEPINTTEGRAVLHTALRLPPGASLRVAGQDAAADAARVRERVATFAERVRSGDWRGHRGERIRHVINLGIGGSDLGPLMVQQALTPFAARDIDVHFVSNVDGRHLADVLARIDAAQGAGQTLVIVASKTFTTLETMMNAHSARDWLLAHGVPQNALSQHVVAVSTNVEAARAFGVAEENVFPFWDWVGGRYSVWSAIGLAVVIATGAERFAQFLAGAHAMDQHFAQAPLERNLPVLMALAGIWNVNFLGSSALSIAPYHQRLARLPAYLQQLEMESNGKRVSIDGTLLDYATCPVLFGEPGTNGQHAYFQLLHQGTQPVPVDFIAVAQDDSGLAGHNDALLANCFAQSQALAFGKSVDEARAEMPSQPSLAAHRTFPGDRPSSTVLLDALTPATLGALLSLYEHKVFVQGVIWGVNSFDQWGVELGKVLAKEIAPWLTTGTGKSLDSSTVGLVARVRRRTDDEH